MINHNEGEHMANLITGLRIICSIVLFTGALLFVLPLTLPFINLKYSALAVCLVATFAAIQEGHFIRTGKEVS